MSKELRKEMFLNPGNVQKVLINVDENGEMIESTLDEFEQLIAENINSEKANLRSGYLTVLGYYTSKINCIYSMGMPIE
ncbi:hypothetical protein LAX74_003415 [Listeria marthii]|nr:hypothetical protein [Listeria marthii]UHP13692.1 hypothetical protein LAX74_003415 [Listeria marthii]